MENNTNQVAGYGGGVNSVQPVAGNGLPTFGVLVTSATPCGFGFLLGIAALSHALSPQSAPNLGQR